MIGGLYILLGIIGGFIGFALSISMRLSASIFGFLFTPFTFELLTLLLLSTLDSVIYFIYFT